MDKTSHIPAPVASSSQGAVGEQRASSAGEVFGRKVECTICKEGMIPEQQDIRVLSCNSGHSFHASCIDRWLRDYPSCPMCRSPVETLDVHAVTSYSSPDSARTTLFSTHLPQARVAENRSRGFRFQQQLSLNPVTWSYPEKTPEGAPRSHAEALAPELTRYISQGNASWVRRVLNYGACPSLVDRGAMLQALEQAVTAGNLDETEGWLLCVPLTDRVRQIMSTAMERAAGAGAEDNRIDIDQYAWLLGFGIDPTLEAVTAAGDRLVYHARWRDLALLEAWLSLDIPAGSDVVMAIEETRVQLLSHSHSKDRAQGWSELLKRLQ